MARQAKNTILKQTPQPVTGILEKEKPLLPADIMAPRILLLLSAFALLLIGVVMVYSASSIAGISEGGGPESYVVRQLIYAVIGIAGCLVIWRFIPYSLWTGWLVWVIWGIAIALLLSTALFGIVGLGAQRWLTIGNFSLQPSEFAKIAFLLMTARILFDFRNGDLSVRALFIQAFLLIVLPLLFLYRTQSDLGTTVICFFGILAVMWLAEVRWKVILGTIALAALFAVFASLFTSYRSDRMIFLNPWDDGQGGLGAGWQLIHSFYAFAEGGLFGVGLGNSREKFLYLPEAETDFIFAIIGEELGMIGAGIVIILFLVFLYAGMRIAQKSPEGFGLLLAGGFTTMIAFQAFLNIGCVIGVLPTTGKPLPFVSSGGSALIASLFMLGIILSVSRGSNQKDVYRERRADLRVVREKTDEEKRVTIEEPVRVNKKRKKDSNTQTPILPFEEMKSSSHQGFDLTSMPGSDSTKRREKRGQNSKTSSKDSGHYGSRLNRKDK